MQPPVYDALAIKAGEGTDRDRFWKTSLDLLLARRGVTSLEYGIIAGVIVATLTVGFSLFANSLSKTFSTLGGSI